MIDNLCIIRLHPLRGALFRKLGGVGVVYKAPAHQGEQPILRHYRESRGLELDVLEQPGDYLHTVEVKSATTAAPNFFKGFKQIAERIQDSRPVIASR